MTKKLRLLVHVVWMVAFTFQISSCVKEDDMMNISTGTISGIVTDVDDQPVSGVEVTIVGIGDPEIVVTTGSDGHFSVDNVQMKTLGIKFSKSGWLTTSRTINASNFDSDRVALVEVSLINASAIIKGNITDALNNSAPLEGVTVSVGVAGTTISGADGSYLLKDLVVDNYTLTFTKANYTTISRNVSASDFVNNEATFNVQMGSQEVLRGMTAQDLQSADKWYYNEYRGGRNADAYPRWDWACNYMSTLDFRGAWEEQNEGTTLQIRNNNEDRSNPADLNVFDSYVYGSKLITEDNKILSLRASTHSADNASPVHFGVQVVDLSESNPIANKVGENRTYASGSYNDFEFDLSEYVGKEVIIAIGIYRQSTGDYWKQLVLRAIRFADVKVENWDWLPGTEVVSGWRLTQETVRSTMPHIKNDFTGISPISGDRGNYVGAYRSWRDVGHIAAEWHFVPLKKDPEVFPSEGYLIKTRNTPEVDTEVPEAYFYSKFSISSGSNQLTLHTRNFGDNPTFFKLTAIDNQGVVTHISPTSNTAEEASPADNGCWQFKHGQGGAGDPEAYATFTYDLSAFNGTDITLALGVYNGIANTGENKLVIRRIEIN
ncbi:carboxypeptidase-like regulatory domain-containing protein [Belliella sp. DSM 111904]|uniref:Carboxypeptidase-like regulatory domain-containing protein n=1 Tax=Belliella filtrata TaxID=2923435 RepID=A0ABS9UWU4_9BACT|nr:carboxypeptidase-like regulatory domain-containing protein [Belliella filtrata]MCH7408523.1 carboxypeptidase-like regulatory domain-containing protein [Belliella filtrata]